MALAIPLKRVILNSTHYKMRTSGWESTRLGKQKTRYRNRGNYRWKIRKVQELFQLAVKDHYITYEPISLALKTCCLRTLLP